MDGIGVYVWEHVEELEIFFYRNNQYEVNRIFSEEGWWGDGRQFEWMKRDTLVAPKCFSEW